VHYDYLVGAPDGHIAVPAPAAPQPDGTVAVTVPDCAQTGTLTVVASGGSATSAQSFTVL